MDLDIEALFELAREGRLPKGFDQWYLADEGGRTVAHVAATYGHLPEGFDRWGLADKRGWTVAHSAARYGRLPERFDQWDMQDGEGNTVLDRALHHAGGAGTMEGQALLRKAAESRARLLKDAAEEETQGREPAQASRRPRL